MIIKTVTVPGDERLFKRELGEQSPQGGTLGSPLSGLFAFLALMQRQGALANAASRANPIQTTACMVQFLKRGDWLQCEVRGLSKDSIAFPQGAETLSFPNGVRGRLLAEIRDTL